MMITERIQESKIQSASIEQLGETVASLDLNSLYHVTSIFDKYSTNDIIDYLILNHQKYISTTLPQIQQSIAHIFRINDESQLYDFLALFFFNYQEDLLRHIKMEEAVFFPTVKQLISSHEIKENDNNWTAFMEFLGNHDEIEDQLQKVNEAIRLFSEGKKQPLVYRIFMNQISYFEEELKRHAILEDLVLMPRVEAMLKK